MGSGNGQHDYHACRDPECERYACRVYREGLADGYDDGFQDGLESCPGPHG